jgi:PAN domain
MPKARRVGLWLAIVGFALAAQGCWDDGQESLTLLGEGGCRAADGGEGGPSTIQVASTEECEAQCFTEETPCAAVEYNSNNGACEIHREPIARFEQVDGVACYAMR